MVHNATHHSFFVTLSLAIDVHPDVWTELKDYLIKYSAFYGIKAEDVHGEGKVHLHCIHIREFAKFDPEPKNEITKYGPRRPASTKAHIVKMCPTLAGHIANYGSKHALQVIALTSTQWIEYINKETPCVINNLPDEPTLMQPYLSEHVEVTGDPAMAADAAKYAKCVEQGHPWAVDPPLPKHCRRFYRHMMFSEKAKRVCIDEKQLAKKGKALYMYITGSVYSDSEEDPSNDTGKHRVLPGNCPCNVPLEDCLECSSK